MQVHLKTLRTDRSEDERERDMYVMPALSGHRAPRQILLHTGVAEKNGWTKNVDFGLSGYGHVCLLVSRYVLFLN